VPVRRRVLRVSATVPPFSGIYHDVIMCTVPVLRRVLRVPQGKDVGAAPAPRQHPQQALARLHAAAAADAARFAHTLLAL
jgi:hypothetical protein